MHVNLALDLAGRKQFQRAVLAAHSNMPHAPGGFVRQTQCDHFIIGIGRSVKKNKPCARKPLFQSVMDLGAARHIKKTRGPVTDLNSGGGFIFAADLKVLAFEIKRCFSRNRERRDRNSDSGINLAIEFDRPRMNQILVQYAKNPSLRLRQGCFASKERKTLLLAKSQKTGEMVDIGIG